MMGVAATGYVWATISAAPSLLGPSGDSNHSAGFLTLSFYIISLSLSIGSDGQFLADLRACSIVLYHVESGREGRQDGQGRRHGEPCGRRGRARHLGADVLPLAEGAADPDVPAARRPPWLRAPERPGEDAGVAPKKRRLEK